MLVLKKLSINNAIIKANSLIRFLKLSLMPLSNCCIKVELLIRGAFEPSKCFSTFWETGLIKGADKAITICL